MIIKYINRSLFILWVFLMISLLYLNYRGDFLGTAENIKKTFTAQKTWYDIYRPSGKVGKVSVSYETVLDEIKVSVQSELNVPREDGSVSIYHEEISGLCNKQLALKSFQFSSGFQGQPRTRINGHIEKESGEILFFLETGKKRKTYKTPLPGDDVFLSMTAVPAIFQRDPAPGTAFQVNVLDIASLKIINERITFEKVIPLKQGFESKSLFLFRMADSLSWINEHGVIIKDRNNRTGLTLFIEPEKIADDPSDNVIFDFTTLPSFKSNQVLMNQEDLDRIKVRIDGITLDPGIYKDSSTVLSGNVLTITKMKKQHLKENTYKLPYTGDLLRAYILPDRWVRSDFEPLARTGRIYARSMEQNPYRLTNYLKSYVFSLIRSEPLFALLDTERLINYRSGDALGRAAMFATYARAAGLPTRLVSGLVYVNGFFYFHQWNEVWLDTWVPVDASFNQFPADVTHIPLKEGAMDDIISIIGDLKHIKIEVLEAL